MGKKALFTGSFDPLTNGHLDIIERASTMFDKLVVGVIMNPQKKSYFTLEEREKMIKEVTAHLPNVEVSHFSGLLADYVNENGFDVIVRGLRGTTDFEYELTMAHMNARLFNDNVDTVFLMTDPEYAFLSSSMAKEVHSLGGSIKGLIPDIILKYMDDKKQV
jgi:pantetheine-phosphate adenylyltransferase